MFKNDTDLFLCSAPKSWEVDSALALAKKCIAEHKGPLPAVPLHLRNAPTSLMKDLGKFCQLVYSIYHGFAFVRIGVE
jgi:putative ATPase